MKELTTEQKELIFDYCIGIASDRQVAQAEKLLQSNPSAAEFHSKLKRLFKPLNSLQPAPCPDDLVQGTLFRAANLARAGQLRLQQLIEDEQRRPAAAKPGFWRNLAEVAAIAAVIMLFAGISIPSLKSARHRAWKSNCQAQLSRIARGMNQYTSDHDGTLPAVATSKGAPWWKVGYQGSENHSNTRPLWLLVRGNYVPPTDFVCPGRRQGMAIQLDISRVKKFADFPSRKYITYSFRIVCDPEKKRRPGGFKVLMADMNPVFERLPHDYSNELYRKLNEQLLTKNSYNHRLSGQNVMFGDGSISFVRQRNVGLAADDIFTLRDKQAYRGYEVPACNSDTFLAP